MKRVWQVLILSVLVVGLVPASWLVAQHQHAQGEPRAAESQQPRAMCPMMAECQKKMEKLVAGLVESFEKVRQLEDPGQRDAAIEEHARVLAQFQEAFQQHRGAMTEDMNMCPMMQKSTSH